MLFHVTADTTWSNLPLSGLFVEMLRRIVAEAERRRAEAARAAANAAQGGAAAVAHARRLRRAGRAAGLAPSRCRPALPAPADAEHPPGFYGAAGQRRRASTRWPTGATLAARRLSPACKLRAGGLADRAAARPETLAAARRVARLPRRRAGEPVARRRLVALAAPRAPLALALLLARRPRRTARAAGDRPTCRRRPRRGSPMSPPATPRSTRPRGSASSSSPTRSTQRTSAALAEPVALDPARDELAFYPADLLADRRRPAAAAAGRRRAHRRLHAQRRHGRSSTPATR